MSSSASQHDPAEGLLIAANLDSFTKEAGFKNILAGMRSMSRGRKALYGGGAALLGGGAVLGGAAIHAGNQAIKTRGGSLHFKSSHDRSRFMSILKTQGKLAAAKFALRAIREKRASFTRRGGASLRKVSSEDMEKEALKVPKIAQGLSKFLKTETGVRAGNAVGLGVALASASVLFGLGAEVVDRTFGGLDTLKRKHNEPRAYASTVKMLKRISDERELHNMGLGPAPKDTLGTQDAGRLAVEEADRKGREANFRQTFGTMYNYAPLASQNPVVAAMMLKEYTGTGRPLDPNQFKQLLELEQNMGRVREMTPFRMRLVDRGAMKELNKNISNFMLGAD